LNRTFLGAAGAAALGLLWVLSVISLNVVDRNKEREKNIQSIRKEKTTIRLDHLKTKAHADRFH